MTTTKHLTWDNEPIVIHPDKEWTCGPTEGYLYRFGGVFHAYLSDDAGESHAPEGHGDTPEDAVYNLLDTIASERDPFEDLDFDR